MTKVIFLAKRPDLVLKLEKYGILPPIKKGGPNYGVARKWSNENIFPYDDPEYQALAERLPSGWEEVTEDELEILLNKLTEAITEKKQEELDTKNPGSEELVRNIIKLITVGVSTLTMILAKDGLGALPEVSEYEKRQTNLFGFELTLHLINSAEIFDIFFRQVGEVIPTSHENQKMIGDQLKLFVMLMTLFSAADENDDTFQQLMVSFSPTLLKEIKKLEDTVDNSLSRGQISGDKAKGAALFVRQARIALEKEDFDGFLLALDGAAQLVGVTTDELKSELKEIRSLAKNLKIALTSGLDDATKKLTTVSQAM